jgi:hypothetical protein
MRGRFLHIMKNWHYLSYALIIIGALNWGLIGFFGFDLVAFLFGNMSTLSRIIYSLVGIAAVLHIILSTQAYSERGMAH